MASRQWEHAQNAQPIKDLSGQEELRIAGISWLHSVPSLMSSPARDAPKLCA